MSEWESLRPAGAAELLGELVAPWRIAGGRALASALAQPAVR